MTLSLTPTGVIAEGYPPTHALHEDLVDALVLLHKLDAQRAHIQAFIDAHMPRK